MEKYLVKAIMPEESDPSEIIEGYDDITKATCRFDEIALQRPMSLGLYKLIDQL